MGGRHAAQRTKKLEVILVSLWDTLRKEPVRVYIYGVLGAAVTALVASGVITGAIAPLIMGVVLAALALPSPVEAARNRVTPVSKEPEAPASNESDAPIQRG